MTAEVPTCFHMRNLGLRGLCWLCRRCWPTSPGHDPREGTRYGAPCEGTHGLNVDDPPGGVESWRVL